MRIVKGLASLATLIVLVVGIPIALLVLVPNPLSSLDGLWRLVSQPVSDQVLVGILAVIGWIAWAAFTISVIVEIANHRPAVRRGRARKITIPGLKLGQAAAGTLVVAVVAMLATSTLPTTAPTHSTSAAPSTVAAVAAAEAIPDVEQADQSAVEKEVAPAEVPHLAKSDQRTHVVERGDFLWDLAEQYLGDGAEWPKIKAANPQLDGTTLQPGQRLVIPDNGQAGQPNGSATTVRVAEGDSLSSIADKVLGDADRWTELYAANRAVISDPDSIEIGQILRVPGTNTAEDDKRDQQDQNTGEDTRRRDTSDRGDTDQNKTDQNKTDRDKSDRDQPAEQDKQTHEDTQTDEDSPAPTVPPAPPTEHQEPAPPPPVGETAPPTTPTQQQEQDQDQAPAPAIIGVSAGLLLAAGLVGTLTARRRRQLQSRRPGRTVPTPTPAALALESQVRSQRDPFRVEQLDQILRAIAAHAATDGHDLPDLVAVRVADEQIHLLHAAPADHTPPGISTTADGSVWILDSDDLDTLTTIKALDTTSHPWPALVTLGRTSDTAHILLNLEAVGALTVTADSSAQSRQIMATLAAELAVSPWAIDLNVTMVGTASKFVDSLDSPNVTHHDDVDQILDGLAARATAQRDHLDGETPTTKRLDPDLADAWCPHVVLIATPLTTSQADRLADIVTRLPRVAIAAATTGPAINAWRYALGGDPLAGRLTVAITDDTLDWDLTPTLIDDTHLEALADLLSTTGSDATTPAPWWDHTADPTHNTAAPATVTDLKTGKPRRLLETDAVDPDRKVKKLTLGKLVPEGFATPPPDYVFGRTDEEKPPTQTVTEPATENTASAVAGSDPAAVTTADEVEVEARPAATVTVVEDEDSGEAGEEQAAAAVVALRHPMLRVFGPPTVEAAAGTAPTKGTPGRTMEVLFTLLEHPGTTNNALADRLTLAASTTRPLVSRLRTWLGQAPDGESYLPAAGLGGSGYRLDDRVTSDWHHAQMLAGGQMNLRSTETLMEILDMVRGVPFAGVIDDWVTADHHVSTITAFLTDAAHIVAGRAVADVDLDLARHAVAKGLLVDPHSEIILTDKVRIADKAGDREETRRLISRIGAHARELGVDLQDDTKQVLAEAGGRR